MSDEQIANDLVENDGGVIVIEVDEGETQTQARSLIDPADWQWQRSVMDSKGREWWLKRYLVGEDGSKRRYLHFFTLDRPLDAERKYDMPSGYLVGWTRRGLPYLYKAG